MNKTKIEWVINKDGSAGYTWNPIIGCKHGCEYCYARRMNDRYKWIEKWEEPHERGVLKDTIQLHGFRKPKTIFVGSMTDLFGDWVDDDLIDTILETVNVFSQHTFLFLTKNPKRYFDFKFPDNCWLGTTITNKDQHRYSDSMRNCFISFEPLLGNIPFYNAGYLSGIKWIIIGTLNRNGKPVKPEDGGTRLEWIWNIIKETGNKRNIPIFLKDSVYKAFPEALVNSRELPYLEKEVVNAS